LRFVYIASLEPRELVLARSRGTLLTLSYCSVNIFV
jgi:hypothetical protein